MINTHRALLYVKTVLLVSYESFHLVNGRVRVGAIPT